MVGAPSFQYKEVDMSVNKVILVGNLGRDPEVRETKSGSNVANLRVATTHRAKVGDEWQEQTEWHTVTVFGRQAELCGKYLEKGRSVYVEGRNQTRKWQDKNGNDRYSTEVVANDVKFLGGRNESRSTERRSFDDEEIPF